MNLINLMTVELQKINLHSVNGPALDVSFDEIIRLMWNEQSKIRLDCYLKRKKIQKYIKCLHCFSQKKWRKRILKSLFFCLSIMTVLRPIIWLTLFWWEMRLQKSGWIAIFEYKFFKSISNVCVVFPQKSGKTGS